MAIILQPVLSSLLYKKNRRKRERGRKREGGAEQPRTHRKGLDVHEARQPLPDGAGGAAGCLESSVEGFGLPVSPVEPAPKDTHAVGMRQPWGCGENE